MSELLLVTDRLRYRIFREPVDMRKSFDGLCGLVERHLGKGIAGERILFFFFNRTRTHVKALLHEDSGMTIFYHRLHGDNFQLPDLAAGQKTVDMDPVMLLSMLRGMEMHRCRRTG